jgi:hypothetical protein
MRLLCMLSICECDGQVFATIFNGNEISPNRELCSTPLSILPFAGPLYNAIVVEMLNKTNAYISHN